MKRLFVVFVLCQVFTASLFAQEYVEDYTFENGYTRVIARTAAGNTQNASTENLVGLIDQTKNLVIPLQYKSIFASGEKGIFIVKNINNLVGLYDVNKRQFILEPQFDEIEGFNEGLATVKKRKSDNGILWGGVDVSGTITIPCTYDYLGVLKEGLINFRKENKMGFLNKQNEIIIPAMYFNYTSFSDGLAAVKISETGKYGFIDKNNRLVIAADYEDAKPFYKGFTSVARRKGYTRSVAGKDSVTVPGQWIVIDKTGKVIQERSFDKVSQLQGGDLFIIESEGKKGTMNTKGMPILPMEYTDVSVDSKGYTVFKTVDTKKFGMMNNVGNIIVSPYYDYVSPTTANRFYVINKGMYTVGDVNNNVFVQPDSANGVILGKKRIVYYYKNRVKIFDLNGNIQKTITDLNLSQYGHSLSVTEDSIKLNVESSVSLINLNSNTKKILPFSEVGDFNEEGIFIAKDSGYSFYDYTGKKISPRSYYTLVNFSEGICALQETSTSTPHLADKNFNKIKDLFSFFKGPYSEGLAYATGKQNGQIYFLDKKGNVAISLQAKEASKCTNGFITVVDNQNKFYHINKKGKTIGNRTWDDAGVFMDGLASVKDKEKWGFIDTLGKVVIEPRYEIVSNFSKGVCIAKLNGVYMLLNKKGEPIGKDTYEAAGNPANGTFPVQKNNLAGLIDNKGNVLAGFEYNSILYMTENRIWAAKSGKWGLLDNKGVAITDFIYQGANEFKDGYSRIMQQDKFGLINNSGKIVVPIMYKSLSSLYKQTLLAITPAETVYYSLK